MVSEEEWYMYDDALVKRYNIKDPDNITTLQQHSYLLFYSLDPNYNITPDITTPPPTIPTSTPDNIPIVMAGNITPTRSTWKELQLTVERKGSSSTKILEVRYSADRAHPTYAELEEAIAKKFFPKEAERRKIISSQITKNIQGRNIDIGDDDDVERRVVDQDTLVVEFQLFNNDNNNNNNIHRSTSSISL